MSFAPTIDMPNIVDVVGRRVGLRRYGKEYVGLCPFHSEKTPSFSVNEEKQVFYCQGCHVGGNVIKFVELAEGMDFKGALKLLGVDGNQDRPKPVDTRKRRAAAILAGWMNEQHLKIGAMLRELSRNIALAEEAGATTFIERFEREFSILEILFDDLQRPECAAEFLEVKESIESITARAPLEGLEDWPPLTPDYRAYLQELVA